MTESCFSRSLFKISETVVMLLVTRRLTMSERCSSVAISAAACRQVRKMSAIYYCFLSSSLLRKMCLSPISSGSSRSRVNLFTNLSTRVCLA